MLNGEYRKYDKTCCEQWKHRIEHDFPSLAQPLFEMADELKLTTDNMEMTKNEHGRAIMSSSMAHQSLFNL